MGSVWAQLGHSAVMRRPRRVSVLRAGGRDRTPRAVKCQANCWDNAVAESFFSTLKIELAHDAMIRLSPQWTVYSPPVHLNAGDDGSKMQHGLAQRLPWRV